MFACGCLLGGRSGKWQCEESGHGTSPLGPWKLGPWHHPPGMCSSNVDLVNLSHGDTTRYEDARNTYAVGSSKRSCSEDRGIAESGPGRDQERSRASVALMPSRSTPVPRLQHASVDIQPTCIFVHRHSLTGSGPTCLPVTDDKRRDDRIQQSRNGWLHRGIRGPHVVPLGLGVGQRPEMLGGKARTRRV